MERVLQHVHEPNVLEEAFYSIIKEGKKIVSDKEVLKKNILFNGESSKVNRVKGFEMFTIVDPTIRIFLSDSTSGAP